MQLVPMLERDESHEIDSLVKVLDKDIKTRLTVIAPDGKVLADSKKDPSKMENHGARPEIIQAYKGKIGKSIRYSTTVKEEMLYVALPIEKNGKMLGVTRASWFMADINEIIGELKNQIIYITIIVVILSIFLVYFFSRSLSKPIKVLASASRKVAEGDFTVSVKLNNKDEIGDLARHFNYMVGEISRLFGEVTAQKEELNNLIESIQDGLVVVDSDGFVLLYNDAFEKMIQRENIDKQHYTDLFEDKKLLKMFRKNLKKKKSKTKEIDLPDRYYLASSTYMESKDEFIFIFSDITEIKELERIKRDIVANVSHELRTPLTAIKGFAETLEEDADDTEKHYINIIRRHADRLISIVEDLLVLSEIEEAGGNLVIKDVDMHDVCENIVSMFDQKLKEKGLSLTYTIEENFPTIKVDLFKIEQVLINLVDNSIKYSNEGEIKIYVYRLDFSAIIEVEDQGMGIPEDDQKRIFERFYTVDKSRSRRISGTGLGLAIVKHIIKAHNGEITMISKAKQGTKFLIKLPLEVTPDNF